MRFNQEASSAHTHTHALAGSTVAAQGERGDEKTFNVNNSNRVLSAHSNLLSKDMRAGRGTCTSLQRAADNAMQQGETSHTLCRVV